MMPLTRNACRQARRGCWALVLLLGAASAQAGERPVPRVPEAPVPISDREVRSEVRLNRQMRHRERFEDFLPLVQSFPQARTARGLKLLAAEAIGFTFGRRDALAAVLRTTVSLATRCRVNDLLPDEPLGFADAGGCPVTFDQPGLLGATPDDTQNTFLFTPWWRQACGVDAEVRVIPMVYSHFHLVYEDPTIDCYDADGLAGRSQGDECVALADPAMEPREAAGHTGIEVLQIVRRHADLGTTQTFGLLSFANVGSQAVKVRYRKSNGDWFQWPSLAGNTIWDVSAFAFDVIEVQVTSSGNSDACGSEWEAGADGGCPINPVPFFVDDFSIDP